MEASGNPRPLAPAQSGRLEAQVEALKEVLTPEQLSSLVRANPLFGRRPPPDAPALDRMGQQALVSAREAADDAAMEAAEVAAAKAAQLPPWVPLSRGISLGGSSQPSLSGADAPPVAASEADDVGRTTPADKTQLSHPTDSSSRPVVSGRNPC